LQSFNLTGGERKKDKQMNVNKINREQFPAILNGVNPLIKAEKVLKYELEESLVLENVQREYFISANDIATMDSLQIELESVLSPILEKINVILSGLKEKNVKLESAGFPACFPEHAKMKMDSLSPSLKSLYKKTVKDAFIDLHHKRIGVPVKPEKAKSEKPGRKSSIPDNVRTLDI
jgi:hypothetical protein